MMDMVFIGVFIVQFGDKLLYIWRKPFGVRWLTSFGVSYMLELITRRREEGYASFHCSNYPVTGSYATSKSSGPGDMDTIGIV